jgi:hypothetical protein
VKEYCDYRTYQKFEKDNPPKEDPEISDDAKESKPKQEGTGQVLFFPLALWGKAFGFNGLLSQTVITLTITETVIQLYFSELNV